MENCLVGNSCNISYYRVAICMTEQDDSFHKEPANKHECSGRLTGAGIHPVLCLVLGNQLSHANADFNDAYAKGND